MGTETAAFRDVKALLLLLALLPASAFADPESMQRYFQSLDLDGDGYVSLAEAAGDGVVMSRFDKADRNKDGKLSSKEFSRLDKVKVRVAKTKEKERSAAVGGTTAVERKRARTEKTAGGG